MVQRTKRRTLHLAVAFLSSKVHSLRLGKLRNSRRHRLGLVYKAVVFLVKVVVPLETIVLHVNTLPKANVDMVRTVISLMEAKVPHLEAP